MIPARAAALAGLALLASCTVGPDYHAPRPEARAGMTGPSAFRETGAYSTEPPPDDWWRLYDAPDLDALVAKALLRNADLRQALATLEAVQASYRAVELERTPQISGSASLTYGQASADDKGAARALSPGPVYAAQAGVAYDFDLFGRIRRAIEAGSAQVGEAQAALDLARINVAAAVTGTYADVCAAGNQIAVARRSIALVQTVVAVTDRRRRGGVSGVNDVVRARALLAQTRAALPGLVARQQAGLYLLATLAGDPPERVRSAVAACATPPVLRSAIPVGDGTALLRRRPDVRRAERRLAGSVAGIGVATGALYPSVSLGGGLGTIATRSGDVLGDRGRTWSLGPLVQWSFPNPATARARIAGANALARADLAAFDGTVLTALRETETAMAGLTRQIDVEQDLRTARDQAAIAARNTQRLYAGGIGRFIDTLDAERTLIAADAALAEATAQVAQRQVQLFLALGGGWEHAPRPEETPLDAIAVPHAEHGK